MSIALIITNNSDSFAASVTIQSAPTKCPTCDHMHAEGRMEPQGNLLCRESRTIILAHGQTLHIEPMHNDGIPPATW